MKSSNIKLYAALGAIGLTIGLAGCGGGSGGGGNVAAVRSVNASAFITDSFREDYDHVWATIFKIELVASDGTAVSLFDNPAGKTIDIKSLRDATGARFSFLDKKSIPVGSYTGLRITMTSSLTLFSKGSASGVATPFDDTFKRDANGNVALSLTFPTAKQEDADDNIVADFDLANFKVLNGKITPSLKEGSKTGLGDEARHEEGEVEGVVTGLAGTAPILTFKIGRVNVVTSATTNIFNANAEPNAMLAEGQKVEVRGKLNLAGDMFVANAVKIGKLDGDGSVKLGDVVGAPSAIDSVKMTFVITVEKTKEFQPTKTTVNIVTDANTIFRGKSGVTLSVADFYARLTTAKKAEVEGVYDVASNTLTAKRARFEEEGTGNGDGNGQGKEAEAKGTVTLAVVADGKFTLNPVRQFEGFTLTGTTLPVITNAQTKFRDSSVKSISQADFFKGLTGDTKVELKGTYAAGTVTATQVTVTK